MSCIQKVGNTPDTCSLMALELFPLSFWRNITADTARATFGTIFFIVEITKGYIAEFEQTDLRDFWRAIKERHPFALTFAHGPRLPRPTTQENVESKMTPQCRFPMSKLSPILPSNIRLSFVCRQPSTSTLQIPPPVPSQQTPPLQLPEFAFRR